MSSDQAAESLTVPTCWRVVLISSSTMATSLITLLTASWASCFAAVVLTEVDDPVSSRRRSRSSLASCVRGRRRRQRRQMPKAAGAPRCHGGNVIRGSPGRAAAACKVLCRKLGEILTPPDLPSTFLSFPHTVTENCDRHALCHNLPFVAHTRPSVTCVYVEPGTL